MIQKSVLRGETWQPNIYKYTFYKIVLKVCVPLYVQLLQGGQMFPQRANFTALHYNVTYSTFLFCWQKIQCFDYFSA